MSFNVQEPVKDGRPISLIIWISRKMKEKTEDDAQQSNLKEMELHAISQMLREIDNQLFGGFEQDNQENKIDKLESYLEKETGKKMTQAFKTKINDFLTQNNFDELSKLICYFGIHGSQKSKFINPILQLSEENQTLLMKQMDDVQSQLQTIVHVKEIVDRMETLEYQNDELKLKLTEMKDTNSQLLGYVDECQTQNKFLKAQIEKYRNEKCETFSALNIDSISDYMEAYRKVTILGEKYLDDFEQAEQKLQRCETNVKELNEQIKTDCMVINNMNDEITKLKVLNSQSQSKNKCNNCTIPLKLSMIKSVKSQKQNLTEPSTLLSRSIELPINQFLRYSEDQSQKLTIRTHNHELMMKLENMYHRYNKLNQEASKLRTKNKSLKESNKNLRSVIKTAETSNKQLGINWNRSNQQIKTKFNIIV